MACTQELFKNTPQAKREEAEELAKQEKWLTVGDLIHILEPLNQDTKIFIRNREVSGGKPISDNGNSVWELSDGLIEKVLISNIDQVTGDYEYVIIEGVINYHGFPTLDDEPYTISVYKNNWFERFMERVSPISTMKQLKERFLKK